MGAAMTGHDLELADHWRRQMELANSATIKIMHENRSLRAKLAAAEQRLRNQEHALNFEQTCERCGHSLEIALRETERREAAEQERGAVRAERADLWQLNGRLASALAAVREIADEYRGDHVVNAAAVVREIDAALAAAEQDEPKHNGYDTYVEQLEKINPELGAQAREVLADKLTEPKRSEIPEPDGQSRDWSDALEMVLEGNNPKREQS